MKTQASLQLAPLGPMVEDGIAIFEQMPVPLAVLDRTGAFVLWSDRAGELWDFRASQGTRRRLTDLVAHASHPSVNELLRMGAAGDAWEGELEFRVCDGDTIPCSVRCAPLHNETGSVVGTVLVAVAVAETRAPAEVAERLALAELGARIARARRAAGLTQQQLADAVGVTRRSIQGYEAGSGAPYRRLQEIAAAVNRPVSWFLDERDALATDVRLLIRKELAALRADSDLPFPFRRRVSEPQ